MKKLIRIIGVLVILFTGTILSTMVYRELKSSIKGYISSDLVGTNTENVDDFNVNNSKNLKVANNNDKNQSNTNTDKTNNNIKEDDKIANNVADVQPDKLPENKSTQNNDKKSNDNKNNMNEANDYLDNNLLADENSTIQNITDNNENSKMGQLQTSSQDMNTTNNVNQIGINSQSLLASGETKERKDEVSESVQAALNITNPSLDVDAVSAILLNANTGKVLFHKNATELVYPASTTKLMTALVALDYCKLSDEVTIGNEINLIALDSSRAYLSVGQRMTFEMLLEGMLIPSGNDAAYSVATYVGRISLNNKKADANTAVQEFVRLMNEKAIALGLRNTQFKNPDGYDDEEQYTTAYDMGIIAMVSLQNETILSITKKSHSRNVFLSGEDVTWYSSNKLIASGSGMFYKYAVGLKTGTSSMAGKCLISAAKKDETECISVIMNSTSSGRWEDSIELLKYGLEKHK
jgi:D-alanyl-D-alanine carboxypeptidase